MDKEDFFNSVKSEADKQAEALAKRNAVKQANLAFIKATIPSLVEIANSYASGLNIEGIKAIVKPSDGSLSFEVRSNHGHRTLLVSSSDRDFRLEMTTYFMTDKGQASARSGITYDAANWNDQLYEDELQKCIQNFVSENGRRAR